MAASCRSCGAQVWWAINHRGTRVILDREPVERPERGLVYALAHRGESEEEASVRPATAEDPGPFFSDHHAQCPQRDAWSEGYRRSRDDDPRRDINAPSEP